MARCPDCEHIRALHNNGGCFAQTSHGHGSAPDEWCDCKRAVAKIPNVSKADARKRT